MLNIRASQFSTLNEACRENYIGRLAAIMRGEPFAKDLVRLVPDHESAPSVRAFARTLVNRAADLGIACEGDVTPFCLLAVCSDPEFRQSGLYDWVVAIVTATHFTASERMDAVYLLLPATLRAMIFQERQG